MAFKIDIKHLEIPFEVAKSLYEVDKNEILEKLAYSTFIDFYCKSASSPLTEVEFYHAKFQHPDNLNYFAIKVKFLGKVLESAACSNLLKNAKNMAAAKVIKSINVRLSNFFKPSNLIGFPNFRGSCFMIVVLIQLFWSDDVVGALVGFKLINKSYTGKLLNALIKLLFVYRKAAVNESLSMINCPTNLHLAYKRPLISKLKDNARRPGFKAEVELDYYMMTILKLLADKANVDYETPGENPAKFFNDLLNCIEKECAEQSVDYPLDLFSIIIQSKSKESGQIIEKKTNIIEIQSKYEGIKSLQELIDDPSLIISEFDCFLKLPKLLTFCNINDIYHFVPKDELLEINPQLSIASSLYELVGLNVAFVAYGNPDKDITYRNVKWELSLKPVGGHVIALLKTEDGLKEINNHEVFEPNREYTKIEPGMMLFYKLHDNTQET